MLGRTVLRRALAVPVLGVPALVAGLLPASPASASSASPPAPAFVRPAALSAAPAPAGSVAVGPATPSQSAAVDVVLAPSDGPALSKLLSVLYDPRSPQYHHWLTAGQFAGRFSPAPATVASATSWLRQRGVTVTRTSPFALQVSGSAARVAAVLGTNFERYRAPDGTEGLVAQRVPAVPAPLAADIHAVLGLDTFPAFTSDLSRGPGQRRDGAPAPVPGPGGSGGSGVHAAATPAPMATTSGPAACPSASSVSGSSYYTLDQLGDAYGIGSLLSQGLNGNGQTIAVFELAAHIPADVSTYESCFGLSNPVSTVPVDGGAPTGTVDTVEADLDIEQAATQAPGATIVSYEGPADLQGSYDTWSRIVNDDTAKVVSSSWGLCEPYAQSYGQISSMQALFSQAAAQGQTVLVSSGDSGSEGCFSTDGTTGLVTDYPASDPLVTAVGGTSLLGPGDETAWNDCQSNETVNCAQSANGQAAAGGGVSAYLARPAYQPAVLPSPSGAACRSACREVPDISANSGVGMVLYSEGSWTMGQGTSFAAPFIAGLVADRNQGCRTLTGQWNQALYSLAGAGAYGTGLNDVTSGDIDMTGTNGGRYGASAGYDGATGLGSPVATGLTCPEVVSSSASSAAAGSQLTLYGTGLEHATFSFGSTAAAVLSETATSATVIVPAGSGSTAISASSVLGSGTTATPFVYAGSTSTLPSTQAPVSSGPVSGTSSTPTSGSTTAAPTTTVPVTTTSPPASTTAAPRPAPACSTSSGSPLPGAAGIAAVNVAGCAGYLVVDSAGQVSSFGAAVWRGDLSGVRLSAPIIAIQSTPDGGGYWLLGADGGVFSFGDARFFGSTGGIHLAAPVVGMAATPDGGGYWVVASDGGVFSYGDARFSGSTGGIHLSQPVDGIAVAPGGNGYWLVASDGGVFAFTPDGFFGSLGGVHLAAPIVGVNGTADGRGYTLVGSDGGVFSFGDAPFYGSLGGRSPASPVVDLSPAPGGNGYYLVTGAGAVYTFGPGAVNLGNA